MRSGLSNVQMQMTRKYKSSNFCLKNQSQALTQNIISNKYEIIILKFQTKMSSNKHNPNGRNFCSCLQHALKLSVKFA